MTEIAGKKCRHIFIKFWDSIDCQENDSMFH